MKTHPCQTGFLRAILSAASLMAACLLVSPAQAQIVDTQTLVDKAPASQARTHIQDALNRQEVRDKLQEMGVDPAAVQARVDSMTDAEAQSLAQNIDSLPAGGRADTVTILLIIIIIILLV